MSDGTAGASGAGDSLRPADVETPLRRFVADFAESRLAVVGFALLSLIVLIAFFAPLIAPQNPYDLLEVNILDSMLPPGETGGAGYVHLLGTDDQGRDMLSAIFYGMRLSLTVGVTSALLSMAVGTTIGLVAAFAGGRVDSFVMRVVDIQISFPTILIALILLVALGRGVDRTILALVVIQWAYYARTVRGAAIVERGKEYMEAGLCLALPRYRLLFNHLLINCMPPLLVVFTVLIAQAVALEATLSFLGLGLPITQPSLGLLIANGYDYLLGGRYWISVFPGVALLLTLVSVNLVGDQLRDVFNPRLRR